MTITITIEPDSDWLAEVETELLDNLTTEQLTQLAVRCVLALGSHAVAIEGELGELGLAP